MSQFAVETTPDGVGVVTIVGRLNMASAGRLREHVGSLVSGGTPRIVVDLGQTTFVDSSGLGALIAGLKSARQAGGDLRIARATDDVASLLRLTNLDRVLRVRDSVAGAFDD
jgi:anti-sigma B factor antagonist